MIVELLFHCLFFVDSSFLNYIKIIKMKYSKLQIYYVISVN